MSCKNSLEILFCEIEGTDKEVLNRALDDAARLVFIDYLPELQYILKLYPTPREALRALMKVLYFKENNDSTL